MVYLKKGTPPKNLLTDITKMKDIAIYGAGGMGRETACLIERINKASQKTIWNLIGFYDDGLPVGQTNEFGTILGGLDALNQRKEELSIAIAIGNPQILARIISSISNEDVSFPNLIDPSTAFWHQDSLQIGKGNIICSNCLLSCNVSIGNFNIFNGDIGIRHDVIIGNYNTFMPGVKISGGVAIGNYNFFGLNSAVIQYHTIGNHTRIGAGAIVMDNTKDGKLYIGIPATIKNDVQGETNRHNKK